MGNGFQFLDIILFAAIAAFFILRLRGVLGKRTGHEKPSTFDQARRRKEAGEQAEDKVIPLPDRSRGRGGEEEAPEAAEPVEARETASPGGNGAGTPLEAGLTQIRLADRSFDPDEFLKGARAAFEMIIGAFAAGDTKALRPLLSNDVYGDFAGAIEGRQKAGQVLETTLVGITKAEILEAELQNRTAFVTVEFVSEQVNVLRDSEGRVIEGDPNTVTTITDVWTFARNTRSRDPNWTLVATSTPG